MGWEILQPNGIQMSKTVAVSNDCGINRKSEIGLQLYTRQVQRSPGPISVNFPVMKAKRIM